MKLGLKTIVLALVVALLCVPAAFAKGPGGNGHGKPSWAGGGGGNGHGKPAWAGQGKVHADKAKAKHEKKHQRAEDQASELQLDLEDLNPAWQCFMVESMMDEQDAAAVEADGESGEFSSFDAEFGTNDNKRNSHGMCVSAAAHGDDVGGALADDEVESCDEPADEGSEEPAVEEGTDDSTVEEGTEEPAADDPADDGSDDQAGEAEECESDDSAAEDEQAAEDDEGEETEVAAFARALVRFIKL